MITRFDLNERKNKMISFDKLTNLYNEISKIKLDTIVTITTNDNEINAYRCVWSEEDQCYLLLDLDDEFAEWDDAEEFDDLLNKILASAIRGRIKNINVIA